jgi:ribosomal protein L7/L12
MAEIEWTSLRPILQDLADRIAGIEQFLAASGFQAPSQNASNDNQGAFDAGPDSFGSPPFVNSSGQVAAVPPDIVAMARSGKLLHAINAYRKLTGVNLREAKAIVEQASIRGY